MSAHLSEVPGSGNAPQEVVAESLETPSFSSLLERLRTRFSTEQLSLIQRAYALARDAHDGQTRKSGEPYITHPIAVAGIVFDMRLDHRSVMAALLHDVLEDTYVQRHTLVTAFGEEVASIVDGLSKLHQLDYRSKEEAQAESFRKMLLAMVRDLRVILIKLADRLHNMRTIESMPRAKQRRIGRETLEVYSRIADRLGMYSIKNELEDLGFQACFPMRSRVLAETVGLAHRNRDQLVDRMEKRILSRLSERGIEARALGREKHLYSLYRKMLTKQLPFQRVFDMFAMRVIVSDAETCYRVLGIVHELYSPIFRRFKDYIAVPKDNGYRSLHTVVNYGADGIPVEVQIRSEEMDAFAESGIAAHWAYSAGEVGSDTPNARFWLDKVADMQQSTEDTREFVESVKVDLYPGEIYLFTPKGRIIQLPRDATPVDFAYAVHSQIGDSCVAAKVDRRLSSLSVPLQSGQTVEIITGKSGAPSPMWLNFVVTAKARTAIRQHLRNLDRSKAVEFGERLLRRALERYEETPESVSDQAMKSLLAEFRYSSVEELYRVMGFGNHLPGQVAAKLAERDDAVSDRPLRESAPVTIQGREGSVLSLAHCCCPIPGDYVLGFITAGKGVTVHRTSCHNVRRYRRRPKESVSVVWAPDIEDSFETVVIVHLMNQPGALARVTSTMSLMNVNIENLDFNNRGGDNINMRFVLSVTGRQHLARIIRRLRNLTVVRSVRRDT